MRKLLLTCECGQTMQVPRSAVGKMGMCPSCGETMRITSSNTRPMRGAGQAEPQRAATGFGSAQMDPPEDAKQKFGEAVDLYYQQRYAEALALFDGLARQFPGNTNIEQGRQQCIEAMRRPGLPPPEKRRVLADAELNPEVVKRVVLEKLVNSHSDAVQLQAAELAAKLLGMLDGAEPSAGAASPPEAGASASEAHEAAAEEEPEAKEHPFETDAGADDSNLEGTGTEDR